MPNERRGGARRPREQRATTTAAARYKRARAHAHALWPKTNIPSAEPNPDRPISASPSLGSPLSAPPPPRSPEREGERHSLRARQPPLKQTQRPPPPPHSPTKLFVSLSRALLPGRARARPAQLPRVHRDEILRFHIPVSDSAARRARLPAQAPVGQGGNLERERSALFVSCPPRVLVHPNLPKALAL